MIVLQYNVGPFTMKTILIDFTPTGKHLASCLGTTRTS